VKPKIQLIVDVLGEVPFRGSGALTSKYMQQALERAGMRTEHVCVPQRKTSPQKVIPLVEASLVANLRADRFTDLRVFRDRTLRDIGPDSLSTGRNAIFFDGLAYGPQVYLQSGRISGYCANSPYIMQTLLGMLLFPRDAELGVAVSDWNAIRPVIGHVPLVAPCLEYPDGYPSTGDRLTPAHKRMLSEKGTLIGHSLRLGKADAFSFAAIVFHLDRLCRDSGYKAARVFVDDMTYRGIEAVQPLVPAQFRAERYFEPVPAIQNAELYWLIRHCQFGLCYDWFPEPFGFYPLDSVFCGVPVFTNGVGNLRFLLPRNHGINVFDPVGLQFGNPDARFAAAESVARRILESIVSGVDRLACHAGAEFIRQNYCMEQFSRRIVKFVEACLDPETAPAADTSMLTLALSPLVRRWCAAEGFVISDYKPLQLSPERRDLLNAALGRRVRDLATELDRESRSAIQELYGEGVVTFALPVDDLCRLDPIS
jgi:hypothetical protein